MTHRILLVDDEPLLRRAFRALLEAAGYAVSEAGSAREALEAAVSDTPSLILLDLGLPDRPGLDVARELGNRDETRNVPVVAFTGRAGPDVARECREAGCAGHLVKPVEPKTLVSSIPAWLAGATGAPAGNRG